MHAASFGCQAVGLKASAAKDRVLSLREYQDEPTESDNPDLANTGEDAGVYDFLFSSLHANSAPCRAPLLLQAANARGAHAEDAAELACQHGHSQTSKHAIHFSSLAGCTVHTACAIETFVQLKQSSSLQLPREANPSQVGELLQSSTAVLYSDTIPMPVNSASCRV